MAERVFTEAMRQFGVITPLGEDALLLKRCSGSEELGRPFEYELELASPEADIDYAALVGQMTTVRIDLSDGKSRFLCGLIRSFSLIQAPIPSSQNEQRLATWAVSLVAPIWLLSRSSNCRIFQNKTVPDIIEEILRDRGVSDFELRLSGTYPAREYCVQYRDSDLHFITRLMEEEGIYYYHIHDNGTCRLVLADSPAAHEAYADYATVPFCPPSTARSRQQVIETLTRRQSVVSGQLSLHGFKPTDPHQTVSASASLAKSHLHADVEAYDYPGNFSTSEEGQRYARLWLEAMHARQDVLLGSGDCRGICLGHMFTVDEHPVASLNACFLPIRVELDFTNPLEGGDEGSARFECRFEAIPIDTPYRMERVSSKPLISGPQTAIVVGRSGEEIDASPIGSVKLRFHWDRNSTADENSSCWVRVAQAWAGTGYGALFTPRIGQEVIVEFLDGDPDRPLITGRLYNETSAPPYDPSSEQRTVSTFKTNASPGGGVFNELRFDDTAGEEQIFLHAGRDLESRTANDRVEYVGNEHHEIIEQNSYRELRAEQHETIKADVKKRVEGSEHYETRQDRQHKLGSKFAVDAGQEIHLKAGANVIIEAAAGVTLKSGGNFISIGPSGVAITGNPTLINSGGAAGSGSGANPDQPTLPREAVEAEPGEVDPTPSPLAHSLRAAALNGTPFCEVCMRAREELAAAQAASTPSASAPPAASPPPTAGRDA